MHQIYSVDRSNFLRPLAASLIILVGVFFIPTMGVGLFFAENIGLFLIKHWELYLFVLAVMASILIYRQLKFYSKDIKTNRLHKGREVIITDDTLMLTPSLVEEKSSFGRSLRDSLNRSSDGYLLMSFKDILSWSFVDIRSQRSSLKYHEIRFMDKWNKEINFSIDRSPFRSFFNNTDREFTNSIKEKLGARFKTNVNTSGDPF